MTVTDIPSSTCMYLVNVTAAVSPKIGFREEFNNRTVGLHYSVQGFLFFGELTFSLFSVILDRNILSFGALDQIVV